MDDQRDTDSDGVFEQELPPKTIAWSRFTDSVERLLDSSPLFGAAVRQTFLEFQTNSQLPAASLLPALQALFKKLIDGVDPKVWTLTLRQFTYYDIFTLVAKDSFDIYEPMDLARFEFAARQACKNLAVERTKRLGKFLIGGIMAIHVLQHVVKGIPYIGKPTSKFIMPFLGPIFGLLGAIYWEGD